MHSPSWDNLRYVLTVADKGSVSEAARALGVNHATVLRRVAAFEAQQGGAVFEKTPTGYRVLPDRLRVIEAAREVRNAHLAVERLMHGSSEKVRERVRVSSTDTLSCFVLPGMLAQINAQTPDLRIELLSSNSHLDFSRLQADISVRPAMLLPEEMVGDAPVSLVFAAYAVPDAPRVWLGLSGPLARARPATWMAETLAPDQIADGADSFLVLSEMARQGLGIAVLPTFVGDNTRGLEPLPGAMPALTVPVWVATHSELKDAPRIRMVRRQIVEHLGANAELLERRK